MTVASDELEDAQYGIGQAVDEFLQKVYPPSFFQRESSQTCDASLDAKIGVRGSQLLLSGPESLRMTHRLRAMHSAILVGVGTVLNEDPSLTCRIPHLLPLARQPSPYVLDSTLRTPPSCKLITNARKGISRPLTIICLPLHTAGEAATLRAVALRAAGCMLLEIDSDDKASPPAKRSPSLASFLAALPPETSMMVEGGSTVISSCLSLRTQVNRIVITTAPKFVGANGVAVCVDDPDRLVSSSSLYIRLVTEVFDLNRCRICSTSHHAFLAKTL
ncbi:2,5-diamino-6-(ribosylamino)-4(3H)-pyrimidinone 5'-phosphate reductase [Cystobasidiomycetes sp. EMM_F5]